MLGRRRIQRSNLQERLRMRILLNKELPYLFTVLLGLIAYQVNNIVEIQSKSPILSYKFESFNIVKKENIKTYRLSCTLSNYSKNKSLREIRIDMSFKTSLPNPKKIYNPNIISVSPSAILPSSNWNSHQKLINQYNIPIIHPNSTYILEADIEVEKNIDEFPKIYLHSENEIRIVPYNFEVLLVKYQLPINVLLLFIWVVFSIIYITVLSKKPKLNEDS